MLSNQVFTEKSLRIELQETDKEIRLIWTGRSNEREPGRFLIPILDQALARCHGAAQALVLDFRALEYMNSSTFTPVVMALEQARSGCASVRLLFRSSLRWQTLSFSALKVFETHDGRIQLCGEAG